MLLFTGDILLQFANLQVEFVMRLLRTSMEGRVVMFSRASLPAVPVAGVVSGAAGAGDLASVPA